MNELNREIGEQVCALTTEAYFVGGCVRDLLLGEPLKDIDIALRGDTKAVGQRLARAYDGHVFWLREEEGVVRVLLPHGPGEQLQLDLCPLRGSIEDDLRARDLTFNALAIRAADGLRPEAPRLDLSGGEADLQARVVRFVQPSAPESDPLRTFRALRFKWKLGCTLAEETVERIRACAPLLERVSVERIRDEMFQLLAMPGAAGALGEALEFGLGRWLIGPGWSAAPGPAPAESLRRMQALLAGLELEDLKSLLLMEPTSPRRRREVLLWASALQPAFIAGADSGTMARYLALSGDERRLIVKGLAGAVTAAQLAAAWPVPGRTRYHLFREAGSAGPEAVLLAASQSGAWSTAYEGLLTEAIDRHNHPRPPLLTGLDVMEALQLRAGPKIGRALEAVEEARADGRIHTREEALEWLRSFEV